MGRADVSGIADFRKPVSSISVKKELITYGTSSEPCLLMVFSALEKYESRILRHVDKLEGCIMADVIASRESDARSLLYWFAFDAMGDFVFGRPFGMLDKRDWHLIVTRLRRALSLMGPFSSAPWLIQIGLRLPRFHVIKDWWDMIGWCQRQMEERIKEGSNHLEPDLTHYLTKTDLKVESSDEDIMSWLDGDSLLGVVAGR
jgi:hypothetical protein